MSKKERPFLFGAVVGSGLTAKAADASGADYLLALNAGRFRVQGASSLASFLPIRSANDWVIEFSERELLGRCTSPLYAGLSVSDPGLDIDSLVEGIKDLGFTGVCNFPSTTSIDGGLARAFEREGLGFSRELELVQKATSIGLASFVYVQTNVQARQMVDVGAEAICVNIGFTGGATGVSTHLTLDMAAARIDRVLDGILDPVAKLCHGGPITSPEEALALMRICRVQGFIAGSTLDRLPIEQKLLEVTRSFTAIPKLTGIRVLTEGVNDAMVGSSSIMQSIRKDLAQLSNDSIPVLISGETGTGKSFAAKQLHDSGPSSNTQPVIVDCPALDLQEGGYHLLGRAPAGRGGAGSARGALERSAETTLILEEINSLNREHQGKLLTFFDKGVVTRVGDHLLRDAGSRVVSTSTLGAEQLALGTALRKDLFYRIAGHVIVLPPLRDRIDDVPELAVYLARDLTGGETPKFSNAALRVLLEHDWLGNVRELRFALVRALRNSVGGTVQRSSVEFLETARQAKNTDSPIGVPSYAQSDRLASERDLLLEVLVRNGYRRARTAEELGITTRTLYTKIKKFGIQV